MCHDCGRQNRRGGRYCSACYQRRYRQNPEAYARHKARVLAYQKRNPAKRLVWVHNYRARIGWYNPDLTALRAALKRVEQALAQTTRRQDVRGAGQ